jgi:hypothetical protein
MGKVLEESEMVRGIDVSLLSSRGAERRGDLSCHHEIAALRFVIRFFVN